MVDRERCAAISSDTKSEEIPVVSDHVPRQHSPGTPVSALPSARKYSRTRVSVAKKWKYVCVNKTCGKVERTDQAPTTTKQCPVCGNMMVRKVG